MGQALKGEKTGIERRRKRVKIKKGEGGDGRGSSLKNLYIDAVRII